MGPLSISDLAAVSQAAIALIGVTLVMLQLYKAGKLARVQHIAQMNDRLASFYDVVSKFRTLTDISSWNAFDDVTKERMLDYISVFETIESMRRHGTLSMKEIDYFFAGRFSALVDVRGVQAAILYNPEYRDQLYPLFSLHRALAAYRGASSSATPLDAFDPPTYSRLADRR